MIGPDDKTPNPEGPTPADFADRFRRLEKEFRELRREFESHKTDEHDEVDSRLDKHDVQFEDMKRLIISHQTTNGLILQGVDRKLELMIEMVRELRPRPALEVTAATVLP